MIEKVLAEQIQVEIIQDTHKEIERIYQELTQSEKHRRRPVNPVPKANDQQATDYIKRHHFRHGSHATNGEMLSAKKKKMWLLLAERLEEAHRLGIYKEPVNTICRFICLIYPCVKHNTIRKALPYKYKEPNQSRIACRQMKGLTASIWRHNRKKKKMASSSNTYWPRVYEQVLCEKIVSNSVTPYKGVAHSKSATYVFCKLAKTLQRERNTTLASLRR